MIAAMSHVIRQPVKRDLADNIYYHVISVAIRGIFVKVPCGKTSVTHTHARTFFYMISVFLRLM